MNMPLRSPMTIDAFLAWERRQALRYEFDGTDARLMTGGTVNHAVIIDNAMGALRRRLRPPCRAFSSNVKILAAASVRYPDVVVTCSPVDGRSDIVPNPVVVFEVLSASTAAIDRLVKNVEYRATPSIQRYVMLEQVRMAATVFARDAENWNAEILLGDMTLAMPEIGVDLRLADLYAGVDLPLPETDD